MDWVKKELNKLCMDKILWKSGQMHMDDVKESFFNLKDKEKNKWTSPNIGSEKNSLIKPLEKEFQ